MSYLVLHKAKILLSIFSIIAGIGLNVSLHEVGIHWHYPILSLLFTSGTSIVLFGTILLLAKHSTKQPPPRPTSMKRASITSLPQTTIQVETKWRWEFPSLEGTPTSSSKEVGSTNTSTTSVATSTYTYTRPSKWTKHKHFLACGCLLAGEGICSVFTSSLISPQWQIFASQLILPFTYFIHEHVIAKTSSRQRQGGLIIIACGGFLNGIPLILDTSFNGWCGMFAASTLLSAILSVYVGYLCSNVELHPLEISAWSNVYFFLFVLLFSPINAFVGLQKNIHSFSELFWYQKEGVTCLTQGSDPCHPYAWAYALAFVLFFSIYFILQAMLTQAEDPSIQVSITSLALPVVAIIYQVELTVNYKLLYPIVSMIVVVVGIVVSKKHTLAREYSLMQPYRF